MVLTLLSHLVRISVLRCYALGGAYMVPWCYICWTPASTELWLTSVQMLHSNMVLAGYWQGLFELHNPLRYVVFAVFIGVGFSSNPSFLS